jgi:hypothetical protein
MTLKDQIAADASTVFLNQDDFGETVRWWVAGDPNDSVEISAQVDWDNSQGTNELSGQGMSTLDGAGRSLRRSCKLDVAVAECNPALLIPEKDRFQLEDGVVVTFLREDHDAAMGTLFCYTLEHQTSKRSRVEP